jgi:SOS-response transcriptional repressor LexA
MSIPVSTYNAHERAGEPGAREFGAEEAARYGRRFGVSPAWLLTGEGDPKGGVPLLSWVSAGELMAEDGDIDFSSVRRLQVADLPPGDWIALQVIGDSMDRISPPESIIFVNRRDKRLVANACYVIADENGEATYKRYRPNPERFEPVSVNPAHEPHFSNGSPRIIGRVRRTMLDM